MAIYGAATMKRRGTHITLSAKSLEILDALASARETNEFPATNRTALVEKALQVWIALVKERYPEYRGLIEQIEQKHLLQEDRSGGAKMPRRLVPLATKQRV